MKTISQLHSIFSKTGIVSTDSRNCPEGCLFFALKGVSFDGNKFASSALKNGAGFAVIDNKEYAISDKYILVDNALKTLQDLATYHRMQFNIPVIGITGSNGKTTTKELMASVLSTKYNTHFTKGNFNNHIGVPLTLLGLNKKHEIAIIEMGANHLGEIKELCNIARPTYGIITNVGKAHLEGFGSFEGVIKTKTELYQHIKKNRGIIFINKDNKYLWPLAESINKIEYSASGFDDITSEITSEIPFLNLSLKDNDKQYLVKSTLTGKYNYENILAALTIGYHFNLSLNKLIEGIESYVPSNNRSQIKQTPNNKLILDAYNANPSSMTVAINNFKAQNHPNKIVILGDMKELGEYSAEEHLNISKTTLDGDFQHIWLIGEEFNSIKDSIEKDNRINFFKTTEDVCKYLVESKTKDSFILIKGSRGMKLEQLEAYL